MVIFYFSIGGYMSKFFRFEAGERWLGIIDFGIGEMVRRVCFCGYFFVGGGEITMFQHKLHKFILKKNVEMVKLLVALLVGIAIFSSSYTTCIVDLINLVTMDPLDFDFASQIYVSSIMISIFT
jgi:hypothetical protein